MKVKNKVHTGQTKRGMKKEVLRGWGAHRSSDEAVANIAKKAATPRLRLGRIWEVKWVSIIQINAVQESGGLYEQGELQAA